MADGGYFFCGIGGSGMLPLAMLLRARGASVEGSDRAFDQGRLPELRDQIAAAGIRLHPQDGSGMRSPGQTLVTSSAVEAGIPDVIAASRVGAKRMIRAELLAEIANAADVSVGIAGTSGKSTTTAMLAHVLVGRGQDPAVVNGARMLTIRDEADRSCAWRDGEGAFVCEVDESDGSIALYAPSVGVILNISEDHKSMDELERLFGGYARRCGHVILGIDSAPVADLASSLAPGHATLIGRGGDLWAEEIIADGGAVSAEVVSGDGERVALRLPVIGRFNIANALAALAAARHLGVQLDDGAAALADFRGTARRLQSLGIAGGVAVIDDFAHNPDKIAASIGALTEQYDRLHLFYQPHGYGPLAAFRKLYEDAFAGSLRSSDRLFVSEPAYFGGTVRRTDDARTLVANLAARGLQARHVAAREEFADGLGTVRSGDAVVVMGARDDTLTEFACRILGKLSVVL